MTSITTPFHVKSVHCDYVNVQLILTQKPMRLDLYWTIRVCLILSGIALTSIVFLGNFTHFWISLPLLLIVVLEEGLGRWLFYRAEHR
jgi:hypothetical protein